TKESGTAHSILALDQTSFRVVAWDVRTIELGMTHGLFCGSTPACSRYRNRSLLLWRHWNSALSSGVMYCQSAGSTPGGGASDERSRLEMSSRPASGFCRL